MLIRMHMYSPGEWEGGSGVANLCGKSINCTTVHTVTPALTHARGHVYAAIAGSEGGGGYSKVNIKFELRDKSATADGKKETKNAAYRSKCEATEFSLNSNNNIKNVVWYKLILALDAEAVVVAVAVAPQGGHNVPVNPPS